MKKVLFLMITLAIINISCDPTGGIGYELEKVKEDQEQQSQEGGDVILRSITNTGESHQGHPVYFYRLGISRDKYRGDIPISINNLSIPRVHGGQTVYENQNNAPAFNIVGLTDDFVEVSVTCRVIVGAEEPLKWNISVGGPPGYWFVALHLEADDGVTNMTNMRFRAGGVDIMDHEENVLSAINL